MFITSVKIVYTPCQQQNPQSDNSSNSQTLYVDELESAVLLYILNMNTTYGALSAWCTNLLW